MSWHTDKEIDRKESTFQYLQDSLRLALYRVISDRHAEISYN